jgi:hypothetical protein
MKLDRTVWQTVWTVLVLVVTWSPPAPIKRPARQQSNPTTRT